MLKDGKIIANGSDLSLNTSKKELAKISNYRPSPYLILTRDAETSCNELRSMAKSLGSAIDCQKNYCFYSG